MSITKQKFGTLENGEEVFVYTLDNKKGLRAEILTYGGIIKNLYVTKDGRETDVVLGRDTLEDYLQNDGFFGAVVGRHANRIPNAEFTIGGTTYKVGANEGKNSLHGGFAGFNKKNWKATESGTDGEPALVLTYTSPDGEEGFPGKLDVKITYTLTAENAIKLHYEAVSDKDTVVNLTNHSYFNLNGHDSGTVDGHTMWLNADFYTPNTDECMPYGEVHSVKGTPFDFTTPKKLGQDIASDFEQIKKFGGYDHNFALSGRGYRKSATLTGDKTGITMEMYTDKPGVQIYSGNCIDEERVCKGGAVYKIHQAVCLETQAFPASTSFSHFPGAFLDKGEKYEYVTEYRFN